MKLFVTAILIASAVQLSAQTPKVLTNQDVVDMVRAPLSNGVIIAAIHKSTCKFSTEPRDLIALKKAGVSDTVIEAMESAGAPALAAAPVIQTPLPLLGIAAAPSGATPVAGGNTAGDPNDPLQPHDSGIYLYTKDRNGKPQIIPLERAAEQATKTSGYLGTAMTYGIKKTKMKSQISGAHAGIQVSESSPTFYFYFDEKQVGLGRSHFGVGNLSNPNQFALLKLEVKKNDRETVIGQFGAFGSSSGSDTKAMVQFKSERIQPGLYKVTVENMQSGEYCFLAQGGPVVMVPYGGGAATGATDIFDFGVNTE